MLSPVATEARACGGANSSRLSAGRRCGRRAALAAEPGKLPTIGFLGPTTPTFGVRLSPPFSSGCANSAGSTVTTSPSSIAGRKDVRTRYIEFAADLVRLKVDIILTGGTAAVIAVKHATSTIPIVFATAGDPVGTGLVTSLAHPGGNVTGLSNQQTDLGGYRLELLHEAVSECETRRGHGEYQ